MEISQFFGRDYKYSPIKTIFLELGRIRMNDQTLPLSI